MVAHALNGLFVVASFFNVTSHGQPPKQPYLDTLLKAVEAHCALPWHEAAAAHSGRQHRMVYCFRGVYVLHLLLQGIQASEANLVLGTMLHNLFPFFIQHL